MNTRQQRMTAVPPTGLEPPAVTGHSAASNDATGLAGTARPDTDADAILIEQMRLVLGNLSGLVVPLTLLSLLVLWFLVTPDNFIGLSIWAGGVIVSKTYSAIRARRILAAGIATAGAPAILQRMIAMRALDGALWGSLAWVGLDGASMSGGVLVLAFLAGVAGASVSMYSPIPRVFHAFVVVEILVIVSKLWSMSDPAYRTLGTVAVIYLATLLLQARNSSRATRAAIELRFENQALVEELRIETRRAQDANRAKSRFLAAASHDLRQPVQAQNLFLKVIERGPLTDTQREALEGANAATRASASVLNALLDFSRIEAGVIEPARQHFALDELLARLEREIAPQAAVKGLAFRRRESRLIVESDPTLVELILRNTLTNAVRYTERGGVLLGCRRRGDRIVVEVWDTGIGIEAAQQEEVFREFHQLGNPERDRNKGLGLGLAIAQGLANTLGHALSLASRPGRGSVFRLELPVVRTAVVAPLGQPETTVDEIPLAFEFPIRALIVDDDANIRGGLSALLREWGCLCSGAESIEEALALARDETPDIIISDYRLRESLTGAQAIEALRRQAGTDIPALLITGDTAPERLREALASGVPLLHKPLPPERLFAEMLKLLEPAARQASVG